MQKPLENSFYGNFMKIKSGLVGWVALFGVTTSHGAMAALVDAVEYYYSGHYFMTAFPDEILAVDSGSAGGWKRTGYSFKVQDQPLSGYRSVCRFYLTGASRGSHFYTADAAECAGLKTDLYLKYEAISFSVPPMGSDGSCLSGQVPVYRLYNNRLSGVPNHRYTTDATVRTSMVSQGWAAEGVAFCTDGSGSTAPLSPSKMLGGTWTFSYLYHGSQNSDALTFTSIAIDSSASDTAQGKNQYGLPATARYNPQTAKMEIYSSFVIPATDYYALSFNGNNTMVGCYYFLPTNVLTPSGACTTVLGTRR